MNEVIADKKDVNNEIFWDYFTYQNPSFLAKYLIRATQAKNEQLVNNINDKIIDLRNAIIMKNTPENENLNKIVDMVEKILNFNTQQKGKGFLRTQLAQISQLRPQTMRFLTVCDSK